MRDRTRAWLTPAGIQGHPFQRGHIKLAKTEGIP